MNFDYKLLLIRNAQKDWDIPKGSSRLIVEEQVQGTLCAGVDVLSGGFTTNANAIIEKLLTIKRDFWRSGGTMSYDDSVTGKYRIILEIAPSSG